MRIHNAMMVAATLVSLGVVTFAQSPAPAARHVRSVPIQVARPVGGPLVDAVGSFTPLRPSGRTAIIQGFVQDHLGAPVPGAGEIVVRDLRTGHAVGTAPVDQRARFSLSAVPPGVYTVELVGPSGTVVTSTAAFSAAAGDVIQISQTIPIAQAQRLARTVYTSTWAAISAAASSGVLAIGPGAYVTPGR